MESRIYILYENQDWFDHLKKEMSRFDLEILPWFVDKLQLDTTVTPPKAVFVNRLSASSFSRDHNYSLSSGKKLIQWLEVNHRFVVNGRQTIDVERSKWVQSQMMQKHGIKNPKTLLVQGGAEELKQSAEALTFPFVYKYDCGGKGISVSLIRTQADWEEFLEGKSWKQAPDDAHILQTYIQPNQPKITRCEFIAGKFIYAINADTSDGFELCPAEACRINTCQLDGQAEASLFSLRSEVPSELIARYEHLLSDLGISIAGIEFIEGTDGEIYTYDINCNTNYAPDIEAKLGSQSGMRQLADYLKALIKEDRS